LAKIAVELERALERRRVEGTPGQATPRRIAQGDGWTVCDVVCTSGPQDASFEERHSDFAIALVTAGSFQYEAATGKPGKSCELMTPGSLLFGRAGHCFECKHEHGTGDRCLSFGFAPEYFERIAAAAGIANRKLDFGLLRLPPLRVLSPLVGRACAALTAPVQAGAPWEELGLEFAAAMLRLMDGRSAETRVFPPSTLARVTRALRAIDSNPDARHTLQRLAGEARLSPYHFLRAFQQVTGVTPHQYLLRARLREAAIRLANDPARVVDVAFDCGFGDVSNFNRAFRAELGMSPGNFRRNRKVQQLSGSQT
jgi:AraC family transcriptional regulator